MVHDRQPHHGMPSQPDELSGTGGGLQYIDEVPSLSMANQEINDSCTVACARQLLKDASLDFGEPDLIARIGVVEGFGSTADIAASVLDELHPRLGYTTGSVDPSAIGILCRRDSWIAFLRTHRGTIHSVIVDGWNGNTITLRDPWGISGPGSGSGTRATIDRVDFLDHWHWALNIAIYPCRLK